MLVIKLQVAVLREFWFLVLPQTHLLAPPPHGVEQVVGLVSSTNKLIPHAVVDVQEVVGVITGIPFHLFGEGPTQHQVSIM